MAFEECYCLIWESGIIGQLCEWGPVEQWGRDPSPNLINTLWAENKSVIWPAFSAHWTTVILLCCLWNICSWAEQGRECQEERYSEKWWNSETSSAAQLCEGREGCCVPVGSDDLLTPHPPRIPSYTCSPLWHTLLIQFMTSLPQLLPLERYTSAALCYKTRSHPCMLLHAVHTLTDFILLYWICITQFRVNLKITCSCWRVHFTCVSELTLDKGSILWPKM